MERLKWPWRHARLRWPYAREMTGLLIGVIALVIAGSIHAALTPRAFKRPAAPGRLEILGFYENGQGGMFVSSAPTLRARIDQIDTVVPFWATISQKGTITSRRQDSEIIDFVHEHQKPIIVLMNNEKVPGTGNVAMISDQQSRQVTIQNVMNYVNQHGFDGVHLSFELMPRTAREAFSAFVRELGSALRANQKILGVSVFPSVEFPPTVWAAFDYASIGRDADYVVLHAFDRHWLFTGPGPIAPEPWVEQSVRRALTDIPPRKLLLGVGFYGYDWAQRPPHGRTEYLPTKDAVARAGMRGATITQDRRWQQPTYRYTVGRETRVVWFQDTENLRLKINTARRFGLRGIALWRLGFEEQDAWEAIQRAIR